MGKEIMKTLSRMMLAAAASSLAIAPVAAQAGTRASEGSSLYSASAPGKGRAAKGESAVSGSTLLLALLAAGLIAVAIGAAATGSDDNGQSPGT
jgi:hypothetical protein